VTAVPFIHWTGSHAKNDAAVACYHIAALLAFLRWMRTGNSRYVLLAALFAAASSGVKLPAIFGIVAIGLGCLYAAWKQPRRILALASRAAVFLALGLVWQARTYALTGNPVYPHGISESVEVRAVREGRSTGEGLEMYLLWPWRMHFEGKWLFRSVSPTPAGVVLVVFLPAWLLRKRRPGSAAERLCLLFVAIHLIYWAQFYIVLRYAMAAFAVLFALAGARVADLCSTSSRWSRMAALAGAAFCLFFSLTVVFILEIHAPHFRYFTGQVDRAGYLREALATFPSLEFVRETVRPGDVVFGVGNCSRAYAPEPAMFTCTLQGGGPRTLDWVASKLSAQPYRYLIVSVNPRYQPLLATQVKARPLRRVYADDHYDVYEVAPEP
ncbi:MAG: hypothetical protein GY953_17435, partial [bacterium]|nr:hypothetical protein [bacterium]